MTACWATALFVIGGAVSGYAQFLPSGIFKIELWKGGVVAYRFAEVGDVDPLNDTPISAADVLGESFRTRVRDQMARWSFPVSDPGDDSSRAYIRFVECGRDCGTSYVFIRENFAGAGDSNMCSYRSQDLRDPVTGNRLEMPGRNPDGATVLHFKGMLDTNSVLHELGHCLGLWHEFNREDSDVWLAEHQNWIDKAAPIRQPRFEPMLGNYDYDSVMHYGSTQENDQGKKVLMFRDLAGNEFHRKQAEKRTVDEGVERALSAGDRSRILQYYAREAEPNWGFFFSLNTPGQDSDTLPDPFLAPNVRAVGTPAIVHHLGSDFDIFVRGDDRRLYWRSFREEVRHIPGANDLPMLVYNRGRWTSLGCCFGSDPAAVARANGGIDLFAIGASTGKLERSKYRNGAWERWLYIEGGYPHGGIKEMAPDYLGPAVASRSLNAIDVFVVRADGLLAVSTLDGDNSTPWQTLGRGYNVTARPAAVPLAADRVRLAINEGGFNLYEPLVSFSQKVRSVVEEFSLGSRTARFVKKNTPPALTARDSAASPYRVLVVNPAGRLSHRFSDGSWRDIGGIPFAGTGPAAVATGRFSAYILINNQDARSSNFATCPPTPDSSVGCPNKTDPRPDTFIQPGGLWMRIFQ